MTHLRERIAADPVSGAWFSEEEPRAVHRYALWRIWASRHPLLIVGALNPSTADHRKNDPTVRRDISFAKREGFGGLIKLNAYAFRATDPKVMQAAADPHGPLNVESWRQSAELANVALMAYGIHGGTAGLSMAATLREAGCRIVCLGTTKHGHPRHPLYVRGDQPFIAFDDAK